MKRKVKKQSTDPKVGQKIWVDSSFYISHGSDDFMGGKATVSRVYKQKSGGEMVTWVEIAERPGHGYNWTQFLAKDQKKLKKAYGNSKAHPDPDIDTPWIEAGDYVVTDTFKGTYRGPSIW